MGVLVPSDSLRDTFVSLNVSRGESESKGEGRAIESYSVSVFVARVACKWLSRSSASLAELAGLALAALCRLAFPRIQIIKNIS